MGLISAALGSIGGVLADQWKEFFYCEALDKDTLMVKGQKRVGSRSSNTKGSDNIISNGSGIVVADGQCMMIVEQGKVVEFCAEPGEFTWDSSSEPSIFTGKFGQSLLETFKVVGRRFTMGGSTGKDQRVYYFNTKEIIDNKFGTANPVPFRVVDRRANIDIDVAVRCAGIYSYRLSDPMLFYTRVVGNVASEYRRETLDPQLKSEFLSALQPAFGKLSDLEIRPNQIVTHNEELTDAMHEQLSKKWGELRGIEVVSVALSTVTLPEEDQERIKALQTAATLSNPNLGAGYMTGQLGTAINTAAGNENGAMAGLMGVGMTMNTAGSSIANMYAVGSQQPAPAAPANGWTCPKCGKVNEGNFCPACGTAKPAAPATWVCPKCGRVNEGNFCPACGTAKPAAPATWTCPKCGKENEGNFCSSCGTAKP